MLRVKIKSEEVMTLGLAVHTPDRERLNLYIKFLFPYLMAATVDSPTSLHWSLATSVQELIEP